MELADCGFCNGNSRAPSCQLNIYIISIYVWATLPSLLPCWRSVLLRAPPIMALFLAAVRGKTPSTYAADSGSGWVGKRPFGAELRIRINGDDEEKSAKRPPIYALSLPCLSNYFGHHPPLSFGLCWLFAACLHSVLRLSTAFSLRRLFRGLPPIGPGITFRLSRISFEKCNKSIFRVALIV